MILGARKAFGLVELLVVVSILGVLLALLLPAVQKVRATAVRTACQSRVRQLALALHAHHDGHGRLPAWTVENGLPQFQKLCWPAALLPYIEQGALATATQAAQASSPNPYECPPHTGLRTRVPAFLCPADTRLLGDALDPTGQPIGLISYCGVLGRGVFPGERDGMFGAYGVGVTFGDVSDGLSNTLLLGERPPDPQFKSGWWYAPSLANNVPAQPVLSVVAPSPHDLTCASPNGYDPVLGVYLYVYGPGRLDNPCDVYHYWSPHTGGGNWALADGSVRFLPYSAQPIMKAAASRSRGETFEFP